jgi:hypothetical protein
MLIKKDGEMVVVKDWGPTLIGSAYLKPIRNDLRIISWDMEKLQTSLIMRHRHPVRERFVKFLRLGVL